MSQVSFALSRWRTLSAKPGGKWLFSRLVCFRAPYFATIRPRFVELQPGLCRIRMPRRRAVLNHIGTVHAIAMCNLAELAAGTMTEVSIPGTHRWIPRGMQVDYVAKAETDLVATASWSPVPEFGAAVQMPVPVSVTNTGAQEVLRAIISMWVSPRQ